MKTFFKSALIIAVILLFAACTKPTDRTPDGEAVGQGGAVTDGENAESRDILSSDNEITYEYVPEDDRPELFRRVPQLPMPFGLDDVVATANGLEIPASYVSYRINDAIYSLWDNGIYENHENYDNLVLEKAAQLAALFVVVADYAIANGMALTDADLQDLSQSIEEVISWHERGEEAFFAEYAEIFGFYDRAHFEHVAEVFQLMNKVLDVVIDDPELFAEFEQFMPAEEIDEIVVENEDDMLGAKHILIMFDDYESAEEAWELAQSLYERAIGGEDFDDLILAYGRDPGMESYPQGYTFLEGEMVQEFELAVIALEIGEISEPFESPFGIHIALRTVPNAADLMPQWADYDDEYDFPMTYEERQIAGIVTGLELRADTAVMEFLPALYELPVR
ncbi:MAG: peptidylprolyl isomerase [Defluviitaleaceae bacterium]|nr:peptidylprolyl isomerase [Defluviitaleaceae bacterium]